MNRLRTLFVIAALIGALLVSISPASAQTGLRDVWVDDDWASVPWGADPDGAGPATEIGFDAFASPASALTNLGVGANVYVAPGDYTGQGFNMASGPITVTATPGTVTWRPASNGQTPLLLLFDNDVTVSGIDFVNDGTFTVTNLASGFNQGTLTLIDVTASGYPIAIEGFEQTTLTNTTIEASTNAVRGPAGSLLTITGSTLRATGAPQFGLSSTGVGQFDEAEITNSVIEGFDYGVQLLDQNILTITDTQITGGLISVEARNVGVVEITGSHLVDADAFGVVAVDSGDVTITSSTVTPDGGTSVALNASGASDLTVRGSLLAGASAAINATLVGAGEIVANSLSGSIGVSIDVGAAGPGEPIDIRGNDLSGVTTLGTLGGPTAGANWWGCVEGPNQPGCAPGPADQDPWITATVAVESCAVDPGQSTNITLTRVSSDGTPLVGADQFPIEIIGSSATGVLNGAQRAFREPLSIAGTVVSWTNNGSATAAPDAVFGFEPGNGEIDIAAWCALNAPPVTPPTTPPPSGGGGFPVTPPTTPEPPAPAPGPQRPSPPPEVVDADTPSGFLARLYFGLFGRPADGGGIVTWMGAFDAGATRTQVISGFLASAEWRNVAGDTSADIDFVTALYRTILDRDPDSGGLAFWVDLIGSGQATRAQVVLGFINSVEYDLLLDSYLAD